MHRKTLGLVAAATALAATPTSAFAQPAVGLIGGGANDALATFDTDTPGSISSSRAVTGLLGGERLVGIDYRWIPAAASGAAPGLYGLGVNGATGDTHVYRLDPATGTATPIGAGFNRPAGTSYGFDFNPAVDRIRVSNQGDDNYRAHPDTGAFVMSDTPLSPAGKSIATAAYDRVDVAPTTPAGPTTLFVIDPTADQLATQGGIDSSPTPNGGVIIPVGPLGVDAAPTGANFDIAFDGKAYATLTVGGVPGLYAINKSSGAATLIGATSQEFDGLAIVPGTAQFTTTAYSNSERSNATITVSRTGSTEFAASVKYATGGGSADPATDYKATSGTLTFPAGESTRSFTVELTDDSVREDEETVGLTLSDPSSGLALGAASAALTIVDNDGPAVPPAPAVDTTPPTVTLSTVRSSYSSKAFKKGITVRVSTNEAASIEATLAAKVTKATAARARALAGAYNLELIGKKLSSGTGTRTIKLKPKAALFGSPRKSVKVKLRVVATDAAGNDRTVTKIITVKR